MTDQRDASDSPGPRNPRSLRRDDRAFLLVALAPAGVLIALLAVAPVVYTGALSLFEQHTLRGGGRFAGLGNYTDLLSSATFRSAFWNGLVYTFASTLLAGVMGMLAALVLDCRFRGRAALRALVIFPYIVPTIIVVFIWKFIFSGRGVANDIMRALGASGPPVPWLGDGTMAMVVVVLVSAWAWFPFVAITLLAAMQSLPASIYEAAALEGAGPVARFRHLTLPLLVPALLVILLIRAIWAFRNFEIIWLMTGGGPAGATEVLPVLSYREAFGTFRLGHAAAVAMMMLGFVSALALVYFRVGARLRLAVHGA
jgi:multiple sugar transport system permease protein